jgi:hypothetical protein
MAESFSDFFFDKELTNSILRDPAAPIELKNRIKTRVGRIEAKYRNKNKLLKIAKKREKKKKQDLL